MTEENELPTDIDFNENVAETKRSFEDGPDGNHMYAILSMKRSEGRNPKDPGRLQIAFRLGRLVDGEIADTSMFYCNMPARMDEGKVQADKQWFAEWFPIARALDPTVPAAPVRVGSGQSATYLLGDQELTKVEGQERMDLAAKVARATITRLYKDANGPCEEPHLKLRATKTTKVSASGRSYAIFSDVSGV